MVITKNSNKTPGEIEESTKIDKNLVRAALSETLRKVRFSFGGPK